MEIQKIPQADLLDILFDGRNKEYGAYDLRKTYNRRLTKALAITGSACLLLVGSFVLAGKLDKKHTVKPEVATEVVLSEAHTEKPIETPPPPLKLPAQQQMAMIRDVTTRIVPDNQVKPDEVPPKNDDIENMKIGTVNNPNGSLDDEVVAPPPGDGGKGVIVAPEQKDDVDNTIFIRVEKESFYPGGLEAWKRFLLKNFHPDKAIEEGISGTVLVKFVVDKEGNVSNVEAISGPEELRQEAARVIKKSGKWEPAIQNGRKVNSYKGQPITLTLDSE